MYAIVQFVIFFTIAELSGGGELPAGGKSVHFTGQRVDRRPDLSKKKDYHYTGQTPLQIFFVGSDAAFFTTTGRSRQHLLSSVGDTTQFLGLQDETLQEHMPENWQLLNDEWRKLLHDSCLAPPHVLKNYFLYQFYHSTFGLKDLTHSLRTLYYYFIEFFYLKTLLSVQSARSHAV